MCVYLLKSAMQHIRCGPGAYRQPPCRNTWRRYQGTTTCALPWVQRIAHVRSVSRQTKRLCVACGPKNRTGAFRQPPRQALVRCLGPQAAHVRVAWAPLHTHVTHVCVSVCVCPCRSSGGKNLSARHRWSSPSGRQTPCCSRRTTPSGSLHARP